MMCKVFVQTATKMIKKIQDKIEKYLKKQFPNKMILQATKKEINRETEEIYGFNKMCISVFPLDGKIYYELNRMK